MARRPKINIQKRGGHGIDIKLYSMHDIPGTVVWVAGNSFVVAEAEPPRYPEDAAAWFVQGKWVRLYSINGIGEIRWPVMDYDMRDADEVDDADLRVRDSGRHMHIYAARWFGLIP